MKFDQLKVIRAIVETGSVKAASEHLNKTQPAISQTIKAMEFQIGEELFDRSGYRLELTPLGKRVYLQSLRVLSEADGLTELVRHFKKGNEEKIVVAVDANTNMEFLTPAFLKLQNAYPETRVILRTEILSGTLKVIREKEADIAIAPMFPVMFEEEGFDYIPIYRSTMCNVAAPILLQAMSGASKISDLRRFHQVLVSDSGDSEGMFEREFGVQKGQRRWYVSDLHMKKQLLLQGLGWGHLPEHLIVEELASGSLVPIELHYTHLALGLEFFAFRATVPSVGPVASSFWDNLCDLSV